MVLELGKLVGRRLVLIPRSALTESVPGRNYHIRIETKGTLGRERELAEQLVDGLYAKFRAKVKFIRIDYYNVDLQLEGSPFEWSLLIPWLPTILGALGILITMIAVYNIIAAIPRWAWATLTVGVTLLFFGPTIGRAIVKPAKRR